MNVFQPVERPADRTAVRWAFDVLVMLFAALAAVPYLASHHAQVNVDTVVAIVLVVAPLVLRRVWPVPVFAWVTVATAIVGLTDRGVVAGFATIMALYAVAALCPRRETFVCTVVIEAAMLVAVGIIGGTGWWVSAIFLTGMIAAAVALGLYIATRRAYLLELHDRAERLEREKDQMGALAAAAERARIAREMHDIVAHHLTVMVALSDGAIAATAKSPGRGVEVMRDVSATGRRALADTRRLLGVLRTDAPAEESRHPLPELGELDELVSRIRAAGLPTTLEVQGAPGELSAGVQLTVYRLVQEALTNTMKHGGPDAHASVRLRHLPGELCVQIDDDGAGSDAVAPNGVGGGLVGMRERVQAYGGDIRSGPRSNGGWRVSAHLRLDAVSPR